MQDDPALTWFVAPTAPGQHVLRTRLADGAARTRIAATIRRLEQLTDHFRWLVFATSTPSDLDRLLVERVWSKPAAIRGWPRVCCNCPAPVTPDGFHVKRVYDLATLDDWMVVSAAGYGISMHMARIWYDALRGPRLQPQRRPRNTLSAISMTSPQRSAPCCSAGMAHL
ncbi:MAG: hypothetical protein R2838_09025 [Caldilineaceae bacterium]